MQSFNLCNLFPERIVTFDDIGHQLVQVQTDVVGVDVVGARNAGVFPAQDHAAVVERQDVLKSAKNKLNKEFFLNALKKYEGLYEIS